MKILCYIIHIVAINNCSLHFLIRTFNYLVPGDKSAMNPSGVRFGTPPLTTRRFGQDDMRAVVQFIHRAFELALEIQAVSGPKIVEWRKILESPKYAEKVNVIKTDVETMALKFPHPGREEF